MGSFNPISTVIKPILKPVSDMITDTAAYQKQYNNYRAVTGEYERAQREYKENERAISEASELQRQKNQAESDEETRKRKAALKRAVASQQAAFGGQGIDTTDGSGEAVMLGLFKESSAEKSYRDKLDRIRQQGLSQQVETKRRRNLLDLQNSYERARDGLTSNIGIYNEDFYKDFLA